MKMKKSALAALLITVGIHLILLFAVVFTMKVHAMVPEQRAEVMKITDIAEDVPPPPPIPPPPPPERPPSRNTVESIAENMVVTDRLPEDYVVTGDILPPAPSSEEEYLPMHQVSQPPRFDERAILRALIYPRIARDSGIEGMVYLELFVDRDGEIQRITILRENPEGRGFGEAAVKAFQGRRGSPAMANGIPVAVRYRYPVRFTLR